MYTFFDLLFHLTKNSLMFHVMPLSYLFETQIGRKSITSTTPVFGSVMKCILPIFCGLGLHSNGSCYREVASDDMEALGSFAQDNWCAPTSLVFFWLDNWLINQVNPGDICYCVHSSGLVFLRMLRPKLEDLHELRLQLSETNFSRAVVSLNRS